MVIVVLPFHVTSIDVNQVTYNFENMRFSKHDEHAPMRLRRKAS